MVAIAVRTLGQKPVTCNARPLLFSAHASLERGSIVEAGCKLREAARLYLVAECDYWGCLPPKRQQRSPMALLKAFKKCKPDFGFSLLEEAIGYGNALAHCQFVRRGLIETSLSILHMHLDFASYLVEPMGEGRQV